MQKEEELKEKTDKPQPIEKPVPKVVVEKSEPIYEEYLEEDLDKDLKYEEDIDGDPDIEPYDYKTSVENSPLDVWALIDTYFRDNPYHKTRHQLDSYDGSYYLNYDNFTNPNVTSDLVGLDYFTFHTIYFTSF